MTTLCTYVVRDDMGLAPNPFWDWCTLAVCTPNHQGSKVEPGDWIVGVLNKARGHRFLYAMEVSSVLDLDEYFHHSDFQRKKPNLNGSWQERCGDNFYSRGPDGRWIQHRNRFHLNEDIKASDTKYARAFVASRYWYRGKASAIPARFASLVGGRGARVKHDPSLARAFRSWVTQQFDVGIGDVPNDNPDLRERLNRCSGR
jgi:hypothetical protein